MTLLSSLYRNKHWFVFRKEVLEADGYTCVDCGRGKDEVTLQVHHKEYQKGKLPWQYPLSACETLCAGCHARHHGKVRPDNGWDLLFENDLEDLVGECDLCGTSLRYEFHVHHPTWEPMIVGTVCCDNLTGTTKASDFRKDLARKERFVHSPRWKKVPNAEIFCRNQFTVQITSSPKGFMIQINTTKGRRTFSTKREAKELVFDLIQSGAAYRY